MERKFQGIWIPAELWLTRKLTMQEKLFLVEINSLDNVDGCFATNKYFADFFDISKTRVTTILSNLTEKGFINRKMIYKDGTKEISKRVLNICSPPYPTKVVYPIQQKFGDNNTLLNNTNNNTLYKQTNMTSNNIKDVIVYLNKKTGKEYRYTTGPTIKIVNARYNEGFVYNDFITVIDNAYKHWCNNNNEFANMKPSILFNGSFESRLDNSAYDWVDNNKPSKEKTAEELFNE